VVIAVILGVFGLVAIIVAILCCIRRPAVLQTAPGGGSGRGEMRDSLSGMSAVSGMDFITGDPVYTNFK
jgi:hypothetical protein